MEETFPPEIVCRKKAKEKKMKGKENVEITYDITPA